jgi:hypothetical protein
LGIGDREAEEQRSRGAEGQRSRGAEGQRGRGAAFKGRDFVFGNFLTISADLKILKQPNHVKHLRIFSTIFEILKTLPLKAEGQGGGAEGENKHQFPFPFPLSPFPFSLSPFPDPRSLLSSH